MQNALNLIGSPACKVGSANGACKLTTQECFTNFNKNYLVPKLAGGMAYSGLVGPPRAALAFCQDANPFNTALGLGYNTAANPFSSKPWEKQTVSDKCTGREFIVNNFETKKLDIAFVTFPFGADTKAGCEKYKGTFNDNKSPNCSILFAQSREEFNFLTEGYGFYQD